MGWIASNVRGADQDDPVPVVPVAPVVPDADGPSATGTVAWTADASAQEVVQYEPQGLGVSRLVPILTPEAMVVRTGTSSWLDEASGVLSLDPATGEELWNWALGAAVCAPQAITQEGQPGAQVVCAGRLGNAEVLVALDAVAGTPAFQFDLPAQAVSIYALEDGVVVLFEPEGASLTLAWYSYSGEQVWQQEVGLPDADDDDPFLDAGELMLFSVGWVPTPDAVVLNLNHGTAVASAAGAWQTEEQCWTVVSTEDGFLCGGYPLIRYAQDGTVVWESDESLVTGFNSASPIALVEDWDSDLTTYRTLDLETGEPGEGVFESEDYMYLIGTTEVPIGLVDDEIVVFSPGGSRVLWRAELDEYYGEIPVAGDRILVGGDDYRTWVVRDASTGAVTAQLSSDFPPAPVGDRRVLVSEDDQVSLVELP